MASEVSKAQFCSTFVSPEEYLGHLEVYLSMKENISFRVNESQCITSICVFQADFGDSSILSPSRFTQREQEAQAPDNIQRVTTTVRLLKNCLMCFNMLLDLGGVHHDWPGVSSPTPQLQAAKLRQSPRWQIDC